MELIELYKQGIYFFYNIAMWSASLIVIKFIWDNVIYNILHDIILLITKNLSKGKYKK